MSRIAPHLLVLLACLTVSGCGGGAPERVVVLYTSQDSTYLEGFFAPFEAETGIEVRIRGDTEADKTVGLTQRLLSERERPRADVFWNNEFANTLLLADAGLLAPYESPAAADIPDAFRDPGNLWTGFAARLRVFIVNTEKLGDRAAPTQWEDFLAEAWKGECVLARPLAGTTLTHAAALHTSRGKEKAQELLGRILASEVPLADGNGHVMRQVRDGRYTWGLTDTDDLHLAMREGAPVAAAFPTGDTALVIPNTVALIAGAPHPEEARLLIDWILSRDTEQRLASGPSAQFPVRPDLDGPPAFGKLGDLAPLDSIPNFHAIGGEMSATTRFLEERVR